MKNRLIYYLGISILLLTIGIGGVFLFKWINKQSLPKEGILMINGAISHSHVKIYSDYAGLPFIEVLNSLGVKVEWLDNNVADIKFAEKQYILDLAEVSLMEEGKGFNLVSTPPGGHRFYMVLDRELILSSSTMSSALYLMGLTVQIDIDHENLIVTITDRMDEMKER